MHKACRDPFEGKNADGIATDAKIGGVTETHHPAIAEDQIEAHRRKRQDHDAREQREQEAAAGKFDVERQKHEREQQQKAHDGAQIERRDHLLFAGNRPSGRMTSTIAISR